VQKTISKRKLSFNKFNYTHGEKTATCKERLSACLFELMLCLEAILEAHDWKKAISHMFGCFTKAILFSRSNFG